MQRSKGGNGGIDRVHSMAWEEGGAAAYEEEAVLGGHR
jgi:hypothetical protein